MAVWIMNLPEYHYANWSLGLAVFACTLSITSGILLIPDVRQYDYKDSPQVGGQFRNLSVTEAAKINKKQPEPEPIVEGEVDLKPKIIPQHLLLPPPTRICHTTRGNCRVDFEVTKSSKCDRLESLYFKKELS